MPVRQVRFRCDGTYFLEFQLNLRLKQVGHLVASLMMTAASWH